MALISCKRCGGKTSTEYSYCIHCGAQIIKDEDERKESRETAFSRTSPFRSVLGRILTKSVSAYKNNPPIFAPIVVSIVTTIAFAFIIGRLVQQVAATNASTLVGQTKMLDLVLGFLPYLLTFSLVTFLVTLGLITMAARIVTEGKCQLSDWPRGVRAYLWKVLLVSIVVTALFGIVRVAAAPLLDEMPRLFGESFSSLLAALSQLVLYFCYAAIIFDNAGLQASISLGMKVARASGRVFLALCGLYFVGLMGRVALSGLNLFAIAQPSLSSLAGLGIGLNAQSAAYAVIWSLLAPFWVIATSILYWDVVPRRNYSPHT